MYAECYRPNNQSPLFNFVQGILDYVWMHGIYSKIFSVFNFYASFLRLLPFAVTFRSYFSLRCFTYMNVHSDVIVVIYVCLYSYFIDSTWLSDFSLPLWHCHACGLSDLFMLQASKVPMPASILDMFTGRYLYQVYQFWKCQDKIELDASSDVSTPSAENDGHLRRRQQPSSVQ